MQVKHMTRSNNSAPGNPAPNNPADEDAAASMNNHSKKTVANPSPGSSDPGNESIEKHRGAKPAEAAIEPAIEPAIEKEASR
jgi:hypothetical protein